MNINIMQYNINVKHIYIYSVHLDSHPGIDRMWTLNKRKHKFSLKIKNKVKQHILSTSRGFFKELKSL